MTDAPIRSQADILRMVDNMLQRAAGVESPAEAESLAAKAQELMIKYAIDEAMLRAQRAAAGERVDDKVVTTEIEYTGIFMKDLASLVSYVARVNDCRAIFTDHVHTSPKKRIVTVVGFERDVKNVASLVRLLEVQRMRALNAFMTASYGGVKLAKMTSFKIRREFIHSFAHGVGTKLQHARDVALGASGAGTGAEVALRSKSDVVDDAVNQMFAGLRSEKRKFTSGGAAARQAGYRAGQSADVGQRAADAGSRQALGR